MGQLDTGKSLDALKLQINQAKHDLLKLEESNEPMPELINSTNLLRANEILSKTNQKKTELLNAYESYFKDLESVLKKIQTGLSTMKSSPKKKPKKKKIKRKPKKIRTRKKQKKRKPSKRRR